MPHRIIQRRLGPFALTRTLAWLRLCAIAGQTAAILVCALVVRLPLPLPALFTGIVVLAVFAAFAAWRLTRPWPLREWETIGHVAVDTLVLGYLLYFTGGASNPFVTLLLVPIALSAAALSVRSLLAVALLAAVAYLMLAVDYVPLPAAMHASAFSLHVVGMGVNFAITALLLGFFINRLARAARLQQLEIQRVRERALRDEGILAIATQAAGAAHELNTPLGTMRTLLPELRREYAADGALDEDLALLQGQVERCRSILRELVAFGQTQLSQEHVLTHVAAFVRDCAERFALLRPEAELESTVDPAVADVPVRVPPGLRHALINLLNNAADASSLRHSHAVRLLVRRDDADLLLVVADRGPGFHLADAPVELGRSGKQAGLGLGLALAEATAERLNGRLRARATAEGTEMLLRLPLKGM